MILYIFVRSRADMSIPRSYSRRPATPTPFIFLAEEVGTHDTFCGISCLKGLSIEVVWLTVVLVNRFL
jgi:hypothetical protein